MLQVPVLQVPVLQVVVASTRPGRVGLPVARWVMNRATSHDGFCVEMVDLAAVALPILDEPNHPRLRQYVHQHTKDWSATVDRADAFVFVVPEYNYGYNAALKNALDFLHHEWQYKPVGFVSYGGVAAGTRAVQQLKPVVGALKMLALNESVNIPFVTQFLAEDGTIAANDIMEEALTTMLDEERRVTDALALLRQHR